jgi:hypothetical protein
MGRQVYRPPKDDRFKPGEGFKELEVVMRALSRKQEDVLLKQATREALDKMWRQKGVKKAPVVYPKRRRVTYN